MTTGIGEFTFRANHHNKGGYVALKIMTADALFGEKHIDELNILRRTSSMNPKHPGHSLIIQLLDHFEYHGLMESISVLYWNFWIRA